MTGNATDAARALMLHDCRSWAHAFSRDGSTRTVFLINGVIYKVEDYGYAGVNASEYDVMLNMRTALPAGVFFPEVSLFTIGDVDVIAMDYIRGQAIYQCVCDFTGDICDPCCMTDSERDILVPIMDDPSGFNAIRTDSGVYIIDAA